jgi:hypothetical protein
MTILQIVFSVWLAGAFLWWLKDMFALSTERFPFEGFWSKHTGTKHFWIVYLLAPLLIFVLDCFWVPLLGFRGAAYCAQGATYCVGRYRAYRSL